MGHSRVLSKHMSCDSFFCAVSDHSGNGNLLALSLFLRLVEVVTVAHVRVFRVWPQGLLH